MIIRRIFLYKVYDTIYSKKLLFHYLRVFFAQWLALVFIIRCTKYKTLQFFYSYCTICCTICCTYVSTEYFNSCTYVVLNRHTLVLKTKINFTDTVIYLKKFNIRSHHCSVMFGSHNENHTFKVQKKQHVGPSKYQVNVTSQ